MRRNGKVALLILCLALLAGTASAGYVTQTNSVMTHSPLGMLIPLGIENVVPAADAIMYYNYISIFLIVVLAAFSGMSNESRFLIMVPYLAAGLVFVGWLQAQNASSYWGSVIGCCLLGTLLYVNDMNREKNGITGQGTKVVTLAIMIIVFEASVVLMANPTFSPFGAIENNAVGQKSLTCGGYGYSCDSNGNIDLSASVSSVTSSGGTNLDVVSILSWGSQMIVGMIKFIILVLAAVFLFSAVLLAAYPVLAASPQALLILGVMQIIIWAIYMIAWFNWTFKPNMETVRI
jgi:hypothetical protein